MKMDFVAIIAVLALPLGMELTWRHGTGKAGCCIVWEFVMLFKIYLHVAIVA